MGEVLAELYRNNILESVHYGHAVVMHANGDILWQIGNPDRVIFPRSSCKMLQALPLVESGAAADFGLGLEQLALSCASHNGEAMHVERVRSWLGALDLGDDDLRCGAQAPSLKEDRLALYKRDEKPCRMHNNCSGKHCGFLTLNRHLGGGSEYHELDHPVQKAVRLAFEEMTEEKAMGYGIDGCSAPNFTTSIKALARAAARMAKGEALGGVRGKAARKLVNAMMAHPLLVSGTDRACANLMMAADGKAAVKYGAEAVFVAILPERQIGIALKVEDGAARGAETAIAALLCRLGVVDANDPRIEKYLNTKLYNFAKLEVGHIQPSAQIWQGGAGI